MNRHYYTALRIDNKDRVEGFYLKERHSEDCYIYITHNEYYKVIPKTLGQCIGQSDKDKVFLYEGDMVRGQDVTYSCGDSDCGCSGSKPKSYSIGILHWNQRDLKYELISPTPSTHIADTFAVETHDDTWKRIGNIHTITNYQLKKLGVSRERFERWLKIIGVKNE